MKLTEYNYWLPKSQIAQHPPKTRGDAKLLVFNKTTGTIYDKNYVDIIDYLKPGDIVVLNNTKVIKARLIGLGSDGKQHEILLTEKHGHEDEKFHHRAMYRGKLVEGMEITVGEINIKVVGVYEDGTALLESSTDFMELAEKYGHVPLPPYMNRDDTPEDRKRYQTEFAQNAGSVAAPTASLNMTEEMINKIKAKGVEVCYLTLHVGLGTFMPIRTEDIMKHKMHSEWFSVPAETVRAINNTRQNGRRVVAVGTTVARTLEYCASSRPEFISGSQPQPNRDPRTESGMTEPITGEADIFIYPGYEFKLVDMLLTNFHAPKSTVLMLAAAFSRSTGSANSPQTSSGSSAGWGNLENAYQHALSHGYKFLSYGDSMLIIDEMTKK